MSLPRFFLENQVLAAETEAVFPLRLEADSLCVHGDNAESLAVLRRLRAQLDSL